MLGWDNIDMGGPEIFRSFSGQIPVYIAGPLVDKACVEICKSSASFY